MVLEIGRRSDHCHAQVRPHAHGDHILGHLLTHADTGIEALGHDVGQSVVDDHLDVQVGIGRQQFAQYRLHHGERGMLTRRDAEATGGLVAVSVELGELRVDFLEAR